MLWRWRNWRKKSQWQIRTTQTKQQPQPGNGAIALCSVRKSNLLGKIWITTFPFSAFQRYNEAFREKKSNDKIRFKMMKTEIKFSAFLLHRHKFFFKFNNNKGIHIICNHHWMSRSTLRCSQVSFSDLIIAIIKYLCCSLDEYSSELNIGIQIMWTLDNQLYCFLVIKACKKEWSFSVERLRIFIRKATLRNKIWGKKSKSMMIIIIKWTHARNSLKKVYTKNIIYCIY